MSTVDRIRYTPNIEKKSRDLKAWVRTGMLSALLFLGSGDKEAQAQDNTGRARVTTESSETPQRSPFSPLIDTVKRTFSNRAEVNALVPEMNFSIDQLTTAITQGINNSGITTVREIQVAPDQSSITVILENGYQKMILTADIQRAVEDAQRMNEMAVVDVFAIGSMNERLTDAELQHSFKNVPNPEYKPEELMSPDELEARGVTILNLDPKVQLHISRRGFEEGGLLANYNITPTNRLLIVLNENIVRHEGSTWMQELPGEYSWLEFEAPSSVGPESALGYLNVYRNRTINYIDRIIERYKNTGIAIENRYGINLYTLQLSRKLFENYTIDELYSEFAKDHPNQLVNNYPVPAAFALAEPSKMINSAGVVEETHIVFMQTRGQNFEDKFQVLIQPDGTIIAGVILNPDALAVASTPFATLPLLPLEPTTRYPIYASGNGAFSYAVPVGSKDFGFNLHHELAHALFAIFNEASADRFARQVKEGQYIQWQQTGDLSKSHPFIIIFGNNVYFVREQSPNA